MINHYLIRNDLSDKIHQICTDSDYILWLKIDKSLFNIEQDFLFGKLYIPPMQSCFLNDDEYFSLETEITTMCSQSSYVCLTGDMNARTGVLCDSVLANPLIADLIDFDEDTSNFYNQAELLPTLNINPNSVSQDMKQITTGIN